MRVRPLPRATTSEHVARLSPSSVCPSPACITIPSYARPIPPILSCVAGSEHMHQNTLQRATRRPRIVCADMYERQAAADHTSCPHIASHTLASCPLSHDCSIRACVGVRSTALRPRSFTACFYVRTLNTVSIQSRVGYSVRFNLHQPSTALFSFFSMLA